MTRHEIVKALWRDLKKDPPPRDSDMGVLIWREQLDWAKGWGMRGWARYYASYSEFITFKKTARTSFLTSFKEEAHYSSHWIYLPLPCTYYNSIDHIALQSRLWINVDVRLPPIIRNGGYVLYNPISGWVTVATGISAQNLVYYSRQTERNRVRYWIPLVGPYDTI